MTHPLRVGGVRPGGADQGRPGQPCGAGWLSASLLKMVTPTGLRKVLRVPGGALWSHIGQYSRSTNSQRMQGGGSKGQQRECAPGGSVRCYRKWLLHPGQGPRIKECLVVPCGATLVNAAVQEQSADARRGQQGPATRVCTGWIGALLLQMVAPPGPKIARQGVPHRWRRGTSPARRASS